MVAFTLVLLDRWCLQRSLSCRLPSFTARLVSEGLLGRLVMWRVGFRWYLVVLILPLLVPPALGLSILLGGPAPTADSSIIAVIGMFVFSIFPGSALGEEVGWRGFALPHLQDGRSALTAALILGPVWGTWHLPLWLTGSGSNPLILFPAFVISAIGLSVLLAWI
jgi:CAAX protease family protein